MDCFDPWEAAKQAGIPVTITRLPGYMRGCTDCAQIWVDDRLTTAEARSTLTHELVHVWAGHTTCQPPKIERWVRQKTAELLVCRVKLADTARWARSTYELAEELSVSEQVILDALAQLELEGATRGSN